MSLSTSYTYLTEVEIVAYPKNNSLLVSSDVRIRHKTIIQFKRQIHMLHTGMHTGRAARRNAVKSDYCRVRLIGRMLHVVRTGFALKDMLRARERLNP